MKAAVPVDISTGHLHPTCDGSRYSSIIFNSGSERDPLCLLGNISQYGYALLVRSHSRYHFSLYTFENVLLFGFCLSCCYAILCGNFQRSKSMLSLSVPPLCNILYSLAHVCFGWVNVKWITKWMTISSLSVAVTKHCSQGNLHQKAFNWIAVSEG